MTFLVWRFLDGLGQFYPNGDGEVGVGRKLRITRSTPRRCGLINWYHSGRQRSPVAAVVSR